PCGAGRSESRSFDTRQILESFGHAMKSQVVPQTRGRRAGLDRGRVPDNMGTRHHQHRTRVRGDRRRVAATVTGLRVLGTEPVGALVGARAPTGIWSMFGAGRQRVTTPLADVSTFG